MATRFASPPDSRSASRSSNPDRPSRSSSSCRRPSSTGPTLRGEPVDDGRLHELLDRLGLSEFEERAADRLSGGEAQRVAIARTLFNDPDIVLLDEPAASLDAEAADRVESLLADVMDAYALTAVLVTHDADRARRLGQRGVRLEGGQVVQGGAVKTVVK